MSTRELVIVLAGVPGLIALTVLGAYAMWKSVEAGRLGQERWSGTICFYVLVLVVVLGTTVLVVAAATASGTRWR